MRRDEKSGSHIVGDWFGGPTPVDPDGEQPKFHIPNDIPTYFSSAKVEYFG